MSARPDSRNDHRSSAELVRQPPQEETSRPAMSEVLARIASRDSVQASGEDIRSFIDDDRQ